MQNPHRSSSSAGTHPTADGKRSRFPLWIVVLVLSWSCLVIAALINGEAQSKEVVVQWSIRDFQRTKGYWPKDMAQVIAQRKENRWFHEYAFHLDFVRSEGSGARYHIEWKCYGVPFRKDVLLSVLPPDRTIPMPPPPQADERTGG